MSDNSLKKYLIGETLESFRKYQNFSIKELAEGICSEEELISYEKENSYPDLITLNKLISKLNIDMSYFFNVASKSSINYSNAVIKLINKLKRDWNYKNIYNIVLKELENPIFQENHLKQFLLWHQGICVYYVDGDLNKALDLLNQAIKLTNPKQMDLSEREIEVLTSIAILHKESKNYSESISTFKKALTALNALPDILDHRGEIKIIFGLSQVLTLVEQYSQSLDYCDQGIRICINEDILYLLPNLYYQAGENLIKLGQKEDGLKSLETAIKILKIQGNKKFINIIEIERDKLLQQW